MSTVVEELRAAPRVHYLNAEYGVRSWLLTTDHKRIAILYLVSITLMFFLGGAAISVVRLQLMTPRNDLVEADTYNKLFTMHGILMVFFFLIPAVPAVLGNFLWRLWPGPGALAFPRLNLWGWFPSTWERRSRCGRSWSAASIPAGRS